MAKQTQTEKLIERIAEAMFLDEQQVVVADLNTEELISGKTVKYNLISWEKQRPVVKTRYYSGARKILKACKEAGLKFVPGEWDLKQDEERYAFTPEFNRRDINSQIGEIEI